MHSIAGTTYGQQLDNDTINHHETICNGIPANWIYPNGHCVFYVLNFESL